MAHTDTTPTPYKTGARLRPAPLHLQGADDDSYIDFVDEHAEVVATAWIERDDLGGYTLHVVPQDSERPIGVIVEPTS